MAKFGTLEYVVTVSLQDVNLLPRDKPSAELAKRYARLIDDAAPAAKYRQHLAALYRALDMLATLEPLAAGEAVEHFRKIADALAAHSVASDLGPKLLAVLVQLGMTPAGRGVKGGGQHGGGRASVETQLEKLRRERRERGTG